MLQTYNLDNIVHQLNFNKNKYLKIRHKFLKILFIYAI